MEQIRPEYLNEKIKTVKNDEFLKYRSGDLPTWCPGCGYFGIIDAWYKACRELELKHEEIVTVSGIGCSGRTPIFLNSYGFHTLHGRSIPVASGLKLAREDLTVFSVAGDGDALGIGGGHLPHVARGYAGDPKGLTHIIKEGILHKGFSFIQILTPCVTFDKENKTWKNLKENVHTLTPETHENSMDAAMRIAQDDPYGVGIIFQDKARPHYQDILKNLNKET